MTLAEILDTFKTKFNYPKVLNSLETGGFYNESDSDPEGNDSRKALKNKPLTAIPLVNLLKVLEQ